MTRTSLARSGLRLAPLLALVLASDVARAFDSAGPDVGARTHNVPTPAEPFPFDGNYRFTPELPYSSDRLSYTDDQDQSPYPLHLTAHTLHHSLGGIRGDGQDNRALAGLLLCPPANVDRSKGAVDLGNCRAVGYSSEYGIGAAGWMRARDAWNGTPPSWKADFGKGPEHLVMATAALTYAGLSDNPLFLAPFWVRYPSSDAYVVGPHTMSTGSGEQQKNVMVGQSWVPARASDATAHVVRGVYLPELAQMPDVSSTVWDWVAGNEQCPISGITEVIDGGSGLRPTSAFGGDGWQDVDACHDFTRVMGAVNMSHFVPGARAYFEHYHRLALARMAECGAMNARLGTTLTTDLEAGMGTSWMRFAAPMNTEVHECEREAFVYEMFGQHFLQDAWSTGHMWKRWGYPDLSQFPDLAPSAFGLDGDPQDANRPARRFVIAAVVAAYSGMIHGAKSVVLDALPQNDLGNWLRTLDLVNDPLSAPYYTPDFGLFGPSTLPVLWSDGTRSFQGAGDLYWNPNNYEKISTDAPFDQQRRRVLACSAASLRQVYDAGPKAHGPAGAARPIDGMDWTTTGFDGFAGGINPEGDECWAHWANNQSVLGSMGPLNLWRNVYQAPLLAGVASVSDIVNTALVINRGSAVVFADDSEKLRFLADVSVRMTTEESRLVTRFAVNADLAPRGTQSAKLETEEPEDPDPPFAFLGVPPNEIPLATPGEPPVPFLDRASPTDLFNHPEQGYVRRMFWRAHLEDLCDEGREGPGRPRLEQLRDRCVASAPTGGDTDACTACVDMVEAQIPSCTSHPGAIGQSKCDKLGHPGDRSVEPWKSFYDLDKRTTHSDDLMSCDRPSYLYAVHYCTDTAVARPPASSNVDASGGGVSSRVLSTTRGATCTFVDPYTGVSIERADGTAKLRLGVLHSELSDGTGAGGPAAPGPLVTTFEITQWWKLGPECSESSMTMGDDLADLARTRSLGTLPDKAQPGNPRSQPALLDSVASSGFGFCGAQQRLSWWNQSCDRVRSQASGIQFLNTRDDGVYDVDTGFQAMTGHLPVGRGSTVDGGAAPDVDASLEGGASSGGGAGEGIGSYRCALREPRSVATSCGIGRCGAGGACVPTTRWDGRDAPSIIPIGLPSDY